MEIYLIRHGETASNAARIVQTPEIPLSERGLKQAELLSRRLAAQSISDVLSSDLRRAVMTAEALQRATDAKLQLDAGLQERNYGDIRGRAYAEFDVDILGADYEPPGGETWNEFYARVDAVWPRIVAAAEQTKGNLAVVTHGLVCHALLARHLTLAGSVTPTQWANTSVTVIDGKPPWRVSLVNCTAHLDIRSADDRTSPSGI